MKQPRSTAGGALNQSRFFAGAKAFEHDASSYQPGVSNSAVGAFDPSGLSFGAVRGGPPLGLHINTDVTHDGSLGYASGAQAQMLMQNPGAEVGVAATGKPPKTPTKSRWWRK